MIWLTQNCGDSLRLRFAQINSGPPAVASNERNASKFKPVDLPARGARVRLDGNGLINQLHAEVFVLHPAKVPQPAGRSCIHGPERSANISIEAAANQTSHANANVPGSARDRRRVERCSGPSGSGAHRR